MVQRVAQATDFVLKGEQLFAALRIHHILETKLMIADVFHDELVLIQEPIGAGEVGDVHSNVVAVVRWNFLLGFSEEQPLVATNGDASHRNTPF